MKLRLSLFFLLSASFTPLAIRAAAMEVRVATQDREPLADEIVEGVRTGYVEYVEALLDLDVSVDTVSRGTPIIVLAACKGHTEVFNMLLARGANINASGGSGTTAFLMAACNGHTDIVNTLLARDVNINAANNNGNTALLAAACKGHIDIVNTLLTRGANIDAANNNGDTALIFAARKGHAEIIKALLAAGAGLNIANNNGETALITAAKNSCTEIVNVLFTAGADIPEYLLILYSEIKEELDRSTGREGGAGGAGADRDGFAGQLAVDCSICVEKIGETGHERVVMVPCGHATTCKSCTERLNEKKCPICREPFSSTLNLYL